MSIITPKNKLSQNEYSAKHGLKKLAKNSLYISLMFGQVLWPMNSAMAAPVFDSGDLELTGNNQYTVTDNRAIAQWKSFVLDETEKIEFLNNSDQGKILLNLVTSGAGSKIAGELNANNIQFILVDPSGINIAGSAKVDVSGLVLSTIGVSVKQQENFKEDGNLLFGSSSNEEIVLNPDANIVLESDATLNLNNKLENVVLIGKNIQNYADIDASGLVAMLATDNATLNFEGSNTLGVSFDASALIDDANFVNNGTIIADRAFLASLAKNQAININKDITANQIVISGDKIQLASNITKNNENRLLEIGKLSSESASMDINLDAASELTIGSNSALSGFDDSQISVKANTVNVESETYTKATIKNNNKITLDGFSDISDVNAVSFKNGSKNKVTTNSSASLTGTKNSLETRSVTFAGIAAAELGGKALTGSDATDSFVITTEGITANDIAITNLNKTIDANGNAKLSGASDAWQLTENKKELISDGYTFTGLTEANLGNESLKSISTNDKFHADGVNLTANNILISTSNKNIITGEEISLSGEWSLTNQQKQLSTGEGGYLFSDITKASFEDGASLSGASMSVFEYKDNGKYEPQGPWWDKEDVWVEDISLKSSGITLNNLKTVNNANRVETNMDASLVGGQELGNSLNIKDIQFNGVNNADLGGKSLTGSTGYQDSFEITFQGITANGIAVEGLNTTIDTKGNAELSGADNNTWTISGLNKLTGADGQENEKTYIFTGLDQVAFAKDEAVLNGRGSDTFTFKDDGVLNDGLLDAASMSFKTAHLKQVNNTNKVVTHADAFLQSDNNAVVSQSLKTNGVIFTDVNTADLNGKFLTGSSATDSFVITSDGITANGIAVEDLNTMIDTKGNAELSGADKNTWTISDLKNLTASDGQKKEKTYTFTGLDQVAFAKDEAVLNGRGSDTFEFKDDGLLNNSLLEAASMSFKTAHLKQVNNTNKVVTHADAFLQSDDNNAVVSQSLKTNGVIFTDVNTADLGGKFLTGSSATDSFEITSQGIKANGIAVENLNTTIDTKGNASLLNAENNTWLLTDAFGTLKSQENGGYTFTGLTEADLNNESLKGSSGSDRFNIINGDLQANNILITNLKNNTVNANGSAILSGAEDSIWLLTDSLGTLQSKATGGYTFTDLTAANLSNEGLKGSVEHNRFTVIGNKKLDAAGIEFTGVTSVVGSSNLGHVVANDEVKLGKKGHELTTQNISISGIGSVDLNRNILTATNANQNSFTVTGANTLMAADINFKQVSNVFGYNKQGHVNANAAATLSKDNALSTQGIEFSDIGSMDLGGQTLIGSKSHDSFKIFTNGNGVNANGIEVVNLDRTINANGAVSLSGAQNNIWQLTNTENTLEDSRDNGFVFVGVNAADLQGGVLSGSAVQNKYEIIDTQKLVAAAMTFTGVSKVNGHNKSGYLVANATTQLMDAENQLQTQGVILSGIGQAHLKGNVLKGSAAGSTLELVSDSQINSSGISVFDFGLLDGNENAGTLISKLDTPQWTMTTANSGTVNNVEFTAFKTLKNSTGDLKLNAGKHIAKFDGASVSFGGNTSLEFNEQKNVVINSENNINGSVAANDLNINTAGDVDLKTQVNALTLKANNANLVQDGDLVIHSIDVERTLNLNSADAGKNNLIAGSGNKVNVKATKASLGEHGKWDNIGVNAQPLSFQVASELALVANTIVEPFFPSGRPLIYNLEGDRSDSIFSLHVNALIQNESVNSDSSVNLALFEALSPIHVDKNAVAGTYTNDTSPAVPSALEMEMLAALLSSVNSTAAGTSVDKKVKEESKENE